MARPRMHATSRVSPTVVWESGVADNTVGKIMERYCGPGS